MTTRNEKRLIVLDNQRKRLAARKVDAAGQRRSTEALHREHVAVTCKLLRAEARAERRANAK